MGIYYSKTFPTKPYPTLEGVEFTAQILKRNRPEAKDIQAKDYVLYTYVAELEKEGFLAKVFGESRSQKSEVRSQKSEVRSS